MMNMMPMMMLLRTIRIKRRRSESRRRGYIITSCTKSSRV